MRTARHRGRAQDPGPSPALGSGWGRPMPLHTFLRLTQNRGALGWAQHLATLPLRLPAGAASVRTQLLPRDTPPGTGSGTWDEGWPSSLRPQLLPAAGLASPPAMGSSAGCFPLRGRSPGPATSSVGDPGVPGLVGHPDRTGLARGIWPQQRRDLVLHCKLLKGLGATRRQGTAGPPVSGAAQGSGLGTVRSPGFHPAKP